jgi:hypothetical protein
MKTSLVSVAFIGFLVAVCLPLSTTTGVEIAVPDAGFDDSPLGAGEYAYVGEGDWPGQYDYPGPWQSSGGDAWIDNGYYLAAGDAVDLLPLSGNNKLYGNDGAEDDVYQMLDETFIAGATYTLSAWVGQPWPDYDNGWWLYITGDNYSSNLSEASGFAPESWQQVSVAYTATAADAGKKIGIKLKGDQYVAFESVTLSYDAISSNPNPAHEQTDVPRDVVLGWEPGGMAAAFNGHTVYFGEDVDEVTNATGGARQTDTRSDVGRLAFGQTYYWRVDDVKNAGTVYTGDVWSFTVEPFSIPIETITVTASGANPDMGPEKTIDGSGLNELDQHSPTAEDMWLTGGLDPVWIQYEFDRACKLHEMWVWNSNQVIEAFIGFGLKEVAIETSLDGVTWTAVEGVTPFAQGTGLDTYTANTTVDFGGAIAKYVKLTVVSGHGTTDQVGLSEVRFMAIPNAARIPQPTQGAADVAVDTVLSWRAGREAASHQVSLGTDKDDLALVDTTEQPNLADLSLDYNTTYHWSVTEMNDAEAVTTYTGPVWSFATAAYGTVDDFESYKGGQEVFMTWFDGYSGDTSLGGSTAGHVDAPFVETANVHPGTGGRQSLPVYIDNDGGFINIDGQASSPTFSEVVRDLDGQDWTASGIKTLSIRFAGSADLAGQLYCKIGSTKLLYDGDAANLSTDAWQAWNIDLSTVGGNLTNVRELAIGVEGGTSGILYIDDIRLYTVLGELIE